MTVREIIKAVKDNKAEKYWLVFVDSNSGEAYTPFIIRNNEVKTLVPVSKLIPEKEFLFASITMGEFTEHLEKNCNLNSDVWINTNIEQQYYISSAEGFDDAECAAFHITLER